MSDEIENTNQSSNNEEKRSNIELIYGYTEALLKVQEDSLNRLDTKLSAFLAFAGVLLRFASDLPNRSVLVKVPVLVIYGSLLLKLLACVFSVAAIVVCVLGLTATRRGTVVSPERLMDDQWYWEQEQRCRAYIVVSWVQTEQEYTKIGQKKGRTLNRAIRLICAAAVSFASNIALLSFYT
jgi:hypothetical protein